MILHQGLGFKEFYVLINTLFEKDVVDPFLLDGIDVHLRRSLEQTVCYQRYIGEEKCYLPLGDPVFDLYWFYGRLRDIGRNDQCPCLSNKKYKKCCIIYEDNKAHVHDVLLAKDVRLPQPDAYAVSCII